MPRPVTLFTGQFADLPFEEVCRLAAGWGYDGLEIACWGDHFEVDKAVSAIRSAARCRTPSGSPSPHTAAGRMSWCRWSMGSSQTAWPLRWFEIANSWRSYFSSRSSLPLT